jgi:hypothetical protein
MEKRLNIRGATSALLIAFLVPLLAACGGAS